MVRLSYLPLATKNVATVGDWLVGDNYLETDFYKNADRWLDLVKSNESRFGWMVTQDETPVAFMDLEIRGNTGYIAYAVEPSARGIGLGKSLIAEFLTLPEAIGLKYIKASTEAKNEASKRVLTANGFEETGHGEDGLVEFTKQIVSD
jgi:RimJ/RimL family protein N-acetyltransferase